MVSQIDYPMWLVLLGGGVAWLLDRIFSSLLSEQVKIWLIPLTRWFWERAVETLPFDERQLRGKAWRRRQGKIQGALANFLTALFFLMTGYVINLIHKKILGREKVGRVYSFFCIMMLPMALIATLFLIFFGIAYNHFRYHRNFNFQRPNKLDELFRMWPHEIRNAPEIPILTENMPTTILEPLVLLRSFSCEFNSSRALTMGAHANFRRSVAELRGVHANFVKLTMKSG